MGLTCLSRKKFFLCIVAFAAGYSVVFSQEPSLYRNSYLDPFIINPACTGVDYYPKAHASVESQWLGFPGTPTTFRVTGNSKLGRFGFYDPKGMVNKGPLKLKERVGIGAAFYNDINGPLSNVGAILSYAYHIPTNNTSGLSFGMSLLFTNTSLNTSVLDPDEMDDAYLLTGNDDVYDLNFGSGVLYRTNGYFVGVSANKLLPGASNVGSTEKSKQSYFATAGYKFGKTFAFFRYEPSVEVKYISSEQVVLDIHAKAYFAHFNWVALSYSTTNLINMRLGLKLYKMLYAGYNYGFSLNNVESINRGYHQISLGINLGLMNVKGVRNTTK